MKRPLHLSVIGLGLWAQCSTLPAQVVSNDPSFNAPDLGYGQGDGFSGNVGALELQPDGKLLVGGSMTSFNGAGCNRIARLDPNGQWDPSFSSTLPGYNNSVHCIELLDDSKILVGGSFLGIPGHLTYGIARLNSDGTPDIAFSTTGAFTSMGAVSDIAVQPDGKVIIVGAFSTQDAPYVDIARLNMDGSLDPTFDPGTGSTIDGQIRTVALQMDGRIVIGGDFTNFNGTPSGHIARLNADGSLDASFNAGSGFNSIVYSLRIREGGQIVVGGSFTSFAGTPAGRIAQLLPSGSLDPLFNTGSGSNAVVSSLALGPNEEVVAVGSFSTFNGVARKGVAKLSANGSVIMELDIASGAGDGYAQGLLSAVALRPDGRVIVGGHFDTFRRIGRGNIAQVYPDGSLDHGFLGGTGFDAAPIALARRPDGRIIIAGEFHSFNDTAAAQIASLNMDGSLDISFDAGSGFLGRVKCLALQDDGKAIVGGGFQSYNGVSSGHILRLNMDGSVDPTFNVGTGFESDVDAVLIQPDGKVVVTGTLGAYNGVPNSGLVRLNSNGSLDVTFNGAVRGQALALQPDGRILVGGSGMHRVMPNGSIDNSFSAVINLDLPINTLALQTDGKVIAAGEFVTWNGVDRRNIVRLYPNGTLDVSFDPGSGFFGSGTSRVVSVVVQSNGSVIAAGRFNSVDGVPRRNIARLMPNGNVDLQFEPGLGFHGLIGSLESSWVGALALQPDGAMIVAGEFLAYDLIGRNRIARLLIEPCIVGAPCDDGDPNTVNDVLDAMCGCQGTVVDPCYANTLELEVQGDGTSNILWAVYDQVTDTVVYSDGGLLESGSPTVFDMCLFNGCYRLVVTDDAGDGIANGGYILRQTANDERIIDNRNNFSTGSVSAISGGQGFCLPMSNDKVIFTSCDKLDWINGQYVVATPNAAVSAEWILGGANGVQDANSGYELWIFDPNGSYSFRRFRSHNVSDGFGPASATRACHMRMNNWTVANHVPANVLMNVRVRARVNGVNGEFGPVCRLAVNPALAACPQTQLMNIPGNQFLSCGSTRQFGNGNYVHARPVSGANRYQFRFRIAAEGFVVVRTSTNYFLQLNWATLPLVNGKTYDVDLRVSKNGGATWCSTSDPWGPVCQLTIGSMNVNASSLMADGHQDAQFASELRMFPNPNRSDLLNFSLSAIEEGVNTVSVDIYDLAGKRVSARTIAVADGYVNTVIDLNGELAMGLYLVNITAGENVYIERLVIQP